MRFTWSVGLDKLYVKRMLFLSLVASYKKLDEFLEEFC